ncbi:hypothetical protein ABZ208_23575 [Streptomyces sp. NPDC006208]|uniref:hypothetical protein n=1 Tax=Streptomyces sp. NPDC006208 TaxID=3156734 RepID=UPI0033A92A0E
MPLTLVLGVSGSCPGGPGVLAGDEHDLLAEQVAAAGEFGEEVGVRACGVFQRRVRQRGGILLEGVREWGEVDAVAAHQHLGGPGQRVEPARERRGQALLFRR